MQFIFVFKDTFKQQTKKHKGDTIPFEWTKKIKKKGWCAFSVTSRKTQGELTRRLPVLSRAFKIGFHKTGECVLHF